MDKGKTAPQPKLELSADLKGKYELVDTHAGPAVVNTNKGPQTVDFRTITAEQADQLIADGCKAIKKVESKPAPASDKK